MSDKPTTNDNLPTYKPSELIAIFSAALGRQNEFAKLVSLRGIYQQRQNHPQWAYAYAGLRDESSLEEITLRIPKELYESPADGNLITVGGILDRKIDDLSYCKIDFCLKIPHFLLSSRKQICKQISRVNCFRFSYSKK